MSAWKLNLPGQLQAIRDSSRHKGGKSEAEKTADTYDKLIKQQKEQIALAGQNTELAKLKYQVSRGELSTLTETQKQTLLQNAALIDQQKFVSNWLPMRQILQMPTPARALQTVQS